MHPEADLVLENARVLTLDDKGTVASAIAIRDNRIAEVGDAEAMRRWIGPATKQVKLDGKTVTPGLVDTHCHLAGDSDPGTRVECRDFYEPVHSVQDILDRVRKHATENPDVTSVVAVGSPMQEFRLSDRRRPTQAEMDEACPDKPAYVTFGAHILVANTLAMQSANITADTPDPQGGFIERNDDGTPTGVLRERAQLLLKKKGAVGGDVAYKEAVRANLARAAERGVTTIHDIIASPDELRAYQSLAREGRLPVRVQLVIRVIESQFQEWSLLDLGLQPEFGSDMLRIGGIKMSIDGGFTARQGLFYPVKNEPAENHPLTRITQEELDEAVSAYHDAGMRICVHSVGDKAMDMILRSYSAAVKRNPREDHRHRIEHMGNWLVTDERIELAKRAGVTPVPNPSVLFHLGSAGIDSLGEERMNNAMPIRWLLDEGFAFAPGSDSPGYWPVDPLRDAAFCVSRKSIDGIDLAPQQEISNDEAFRAVTKSAAWLGFMEDKLGTIEVGKLADLAVMSGDPLAGSAEQMRTMPVEMTIMDGRITAGDDVSG